MKYQESSHSYEEEACKGCSECGAPTPKRAHIDILKLLPLKLLAKVHDAKLTHVLAQRLKIDIRRESWLRLRTGIRRYGSSVALGLIVAVVVLNGFTMLQTSAANAVLVPNSNVTSQWPTVVGSSGCTGACGAVNEGSTPDTASYIATDNANTDYQQEFGMTTASNVDEATRITLRVHANTVNMGSDADTLTLNVRINGTLQAGVTRTPTAGSYSWLEYTLTGSWSQSDIDSLQARIVRNVVGGGSPAGRPDVIRVSTVYIDLEYTPSVNLEQSGYRWYENGSVTGSTPVSFADSYSIGDTGPAGGIIYYIDGDTHYESSLSDQSPDAEWGCTGTLLDGADGMDIGTGKQNTADIVAGCGESGIAARLADNYASNGFSDWFLPSRHELNQLYQERNTVGGFSGWYWSSSQNSATGAWAVDFGNGMELSQSKDVGPTRVRAIRSFEPTTNSTTHQFNFEIVTAGSVGAFRFEYCEEDPLIEETCTPPSNLDVAAFSVASQSGASSFVKDASNTNANNIVVNRATQQTLATGESTQFSFDDVDRGSPQDIYVRIYSYDGEDITTASVIDDELLYSTKALIGSPLAAQDTPTVSPAEGSPFRLRIAVAASEGDAAPGSLSLKLQYAQVGADGLCDTAFVGEDYQDVTGPQAQDWEQATSNAAWNNRGDHVSFAFDDRLWVMGGFDGTNRFGDVWSSSDGENWTEETSSAPWGARNGHAGFVHDGKMWIIGGFDGSSYRNDVWSSSDGVNWTEVTSSAGWSGRNAHSAVAYDGKLWVMGGWNGSTAMSDVWSSEDGETWTEVTSNAAWANRTRHASVTFDDAIWVIGGGAGATRYNDVWKSTDGANWTEVTDDAAWVGRISHNVAVFNGQMWLTGGFVGGADARQVWTSSDGENWTQEPTPPWSGRIHHRKVVLNDELWMIGGSSLGTYLSEVWSADLYVPPIDFYDNEHIADEAGIAASPNDPNPGSGSAVLQSYVESNNFTNPSTIPNGDYGIWDFSLVDVGAPAEAVYCFRIVSSAGLELDSYSVVAELRIPPATMTQDAYRWFEGIADESSKFSMRSDHTSLVFDDKMWVIGGRDESLGGNFNDVWSSSDGVSWNLETANAGWDPRYGHASVVFDDKIWVAGGRGLGVYNDVWSSTDGANWQYEGDFTTEDGTFYHELTVLDDTMFISGGSGEPYICIFCSYNTYSWVLSSSDGGTWSSQFNTMPSRQEHKVVILDGNAYLLGGAQHAYDGSFEDYDVYDLVSESPNMLGWGTLGNADWDARSQLSAVAFNNRVWVMGGSDGSSVKYGDVWSSLDGEVWDQETASASWGERSNHTSVVFDGKLWVIGGITSEGHRNDVWSSTDGSAWTEVSENQEVGAVTPESSLGDPLAPQSHPGFLEEPNSSVRLRMLMNVDDKDASSGDFKLQYAPRIGEVCSSDFSGYAYEDLGGSIQSQTRLPSQATQDISDLSRVPWQDEGNVFASDYTYASAALGSADTTLPLEMYDYDFAIPEDSEILGIEVAAELYSGGNNFVYDDAIQLIVGGEIPVNAENSKTRPEEWPPVQFISYSPFLWVEQVYASNHGRLYGGSDDLWGLDSVLDVETVNASNFGVAIAGVNNSLNSDDAYIDTVAITVYYQEDNADVDFYELSGASTGMSFSSTTDDPSNSREKINQMFVQSNNFSIVNQTSKGATAMWDFSIYDASSLGGSYCFRVVRADGSLLDNYNFIPELGTPPRNNQFMRHGKWFDVAEQARPFFW